MTAAGPDNLLASGQSLAAALEVDWFGDEPGGFALTAGYHTVPLNQETSDWLALSSPPASVTVT